MNKSDAAGGGWGLQSTVVRTSKYLDTDRPAGASNPHIGIDYRASVGSSIYNLGNGKVSDIGETNKGAKYITIEYSNGDKVRFLHISGVVDGVKVGHQVYEGQVIGFTGDTGTKHAHLHVDATDLDGNRINPEGMNYGSVTNEEFFNTYGGDYTKLPGYAHINSSTSGGNKSSSTKVSVKKDKITVTNINTSFWDDFKNKVSQGMSDLERWLKLGGR